LVYAVFSVWLIKRTIVTKVYAYRLGVRLDVEIESSAIRITSGGASIRYGWRSISVYGGTKRSFVLRFGNRDVLTIPKDSIESDVHQEAFLAEIQQRVGTILQQKKFAPTSFKVLAQVHIQHPQSERHPISLSSSLLILGVVCVAAATYLPQPLKFIFGVGGYFGLCILSYWLWGHLTQWLNWPKSKQAASEDIYVAPEGLYALSEEKESHLPVTSIRRVVRVNNRLIVLAQGFPWKTIPLAAFTDDVTKEEFLAALSNLIGSEISNLGTDHNSQH
jgi:hypothetical protein